MYLCCAPAQYPDKDGLALMARAWGGLLRQIPDAHLTACYERAMAAHCASDRRTFPLAATDIAHAWGELGEELAYQQRMHPVGAAHLLPAPQTVPLAESNTLPGVLAELAHAWGEWDTEGRGGGVTLSQVLRWVGPLQAAYPEIPPGAMRGQLQKMRLAGVTSLAAAVEQLLTDAAPPMEEAE